MNRTVTALSVAGLGFATTLGGCDGPDGLVGVNGGDGGSDVSGDAARSGSSAGGTGGTTNEIAGAPAAGSGSADGDVPRGVSVNYFIAQIRTDAPENACLPRALPVTAAGAPVCHIYAASRVLLGGASEGSCACDEPGRAPVADEVRDTTVDYLRVRGNCTDDPASELPLCADACVCEVSQAEGSDLVACQTESEPPEATNGWCYVDAEKGLGAAGLVAKCRETERRRLLFHGDAVTRDELFLIGCADTRPVPSSTSVVGASLGTACLPSEELRPDFPGYALAEVTVETNSPACDSGLCVVNHLQGRASCPYGALESSSQTCFVPGSDVEVTVPVEPQFSARQASETATCSCRCDGPGDGPFCTCPSGLTCAPLISPLGLAPDEDLAGSYCIPDGAAYDPLEPGSQDLCNSDTESCGDPRPY